MKDSQIRISQMLQKTNNILNWIAHDCHELKVSWFYITAQEKQK